MKKRRGIYLCDAGVVVGVILIVALLNLFHTANGGDKKGDRITVTPASDKK